MELDDLYREIVLDHYRRPRNFLSLDHIPESNVHENPACGDSVKVDVQFEARDKLSRIVHESHGCAISVASASLMTEVLAGKTRSQAKETISLFLKAMRGENGGLPLEEWGEVSCLEGVSAFPVRVKCATLAWHAILDKLHHRHSVL